MPRYKHKKERKKDVAYYKAYYVFEYGEAVKALNPDFRKEAESPQKPKKMKAIRRSVVISQQQQTLWTDNPSLEKKEKISGTSKRGNFGTLPLSIAENIDGNSPGGGGNDNLGVRVKKTFQDEVTGKPRLFYGIVTAHNAKHGLYKVSYEDGDEEEVTPSELEEILASKFSDNALRDGGTKKRKRKRPEAKKNHSIL